jgi:flavin reductase (DIM6/NTAB) family NADH-FMN oxidoreductase RutF
MTAETKDDIYAVAKLVLSRIAHPVSITGAAHAGERSCGTSTLMYVSHSPAMVAIAEHPGSRTSRLIRDGREFSVSLLHDSQQDLAAAGREVGARPGQVRDASHPGGRAARRVCTLPRSGGSIAILWCRVRAFRGDR